MKNMDPAMLKQAAAAAGMDMPDLDPKMMAAAAEQMKNLSPDQMQSMMKWANRAQWCMGWFKHPYNACKCAGTPATRPAAVPPPPPAPLPLRSWLHARPAYSCPFISGTGDGVAVAAVPLSPRHPATWTILRPDGPHRTAAQRAT